LGPSVTSQELKGLRLLVDLYLLRRLPPLEANVGKRLVKSSKLYLRDSGLVHALLGLRTLEDLLAHPVVGRSYEGFVVENLLQVLPEGGEAYFYRTRAGAEVDLVLLLPGGRLWAVEVKRSLDPRPSRGFHEALKDLKPQEAFVIYPGGETFPVGGGSLRRSPWGDDGAALEEVSARPRVSRPGSIRPHCPCW
jgi:predicted AAA+ superfamily ATPase